MPDRLAGAAQCCCHRRLGAHGAECLGAGARRIRGRDIVAGSSRCGGACRQNLISKRYRDRLRGLLDMPPFPPSYRTRRYVRPWVSVGCCKVIQCVTGDGPSVSC